MAILSKTFSKEIQRHIGNRWNNAKPNQNWWNSARFVDHYNRQISDNPPLGVAGALKTELGSRVLERGVSVGCGSGSKEFRLMEHGLIHGFDLFDLASNCVEQARAHAATRGWADRITASSDDVFAMPVTPRYDLVHWDHALHHMLDVEKALLWSMDVLRPGGYIVVNDYIGPNRLQFFDQQIEAARNFIEENSQFADQDIRLPRYSNIVFRLRQMVRDPSEAPQSESIPAIAQRLLGIEMKRLGGVMIHLCCPYFIHNPQDSEIYDRIISEDLRMKDDGQSHFGFLLWQKP